MRLGCDRILTAPYRNSLQQSQADRCFTLYHRRKTEFSKIGRHKVYSIQYNCKYKTQKSSRLLATRLSSTTTTFYHACLRWRQNAIRYPPYQMLKPNYIAEMDDWARKASIAALVPALIICAACLSVALAVAILWLPNKPGVPIGPLIGCVLIFGFLTFATSWMVIRLIRHERSRNGRTIMPESFIQLFGCIFLLGMLATAILNRNVWLIGESIGIVSAMMGIRSLIRRETTGLGIQTPGKTDS